MAYALARLPLDAEGAREGGCWGRCVSELKLSGAAPDRADSWEAGMPFDPYPWLKDSGEFDPARMFGRPSFNDVGGSRKKWPSLAAA